MAASEHGTHTRATPSTHRQSGLLGLFRGLQPALMGMAVYRGAYRALRPWFAQWFAGSRFRPLALGLGLTLASSLLAYPLDTVRCRMMLSSRTGSVWSTATAIYREDGLAGYFRGVRVVLLQTLLGALLFDPAVADLPALYAFVRLSPVRAAPA